MWHRLPAYRSNGDSWSLAYRIGIYKAFRRKTGVEEPGVAGLRGKMTFAMTLGRASPFSAAAEASWSYGLWAQGLAR